MATSDEILAKLEEIKGIVANLNDDGTVPGKVVKVVNGLSEIDDSLGLVSAGEFRAGNREVPGQGFSGVRMGYPAFTYDGEDWHVVGVNNDALQFGLRASDGAALFGGGNSLLDQDGIAVDDDNSNNAIRVFTKAVTYNSESFGIGDVLIGDNSSNKPNLKWDASAGELHFRQGTVVINRMTTGALEAPGAKMTLGGADTYANATSRKPDFGTEEYDVGGFVDLANDEFVVPSNQGGEYLITGVLVWESNGSGNRYSWLNYDAGNTGSGVDVVAGQSQEANAGTNYQSFATELSLDAGDAVYITAHQDSGGNLDLQRCLFTILRTR